MVVKMAPYQRAAVASERVVLHTRYSYCILVPGVGCGDSASGTLSSACSAGARSGLVRARCSFLCTWCTLTCARSCSWRRCSSIAHPAARQRCSLAGHHQCSCGEQTHRACHQCSRAARCDHRAPESIRRLVQHETSALSAWCWWCRECRECEECGRCHLRFPRPLLRRVGR